MSLTAFMNDLGINILNNENVKQVLVDSSMMKIPNITKRLSSEPRLSYISIEFPLF